MTTTVLASLLAALDQATRFNDSLQAPPAAVLWTDRERQWQAVIPSLQARRPQLLVLGDYAPEHKRGPAIWLKCMIARTLEAVDWPADAAPIIYLPGVSRLDLRALETCPRELQPLAELQYRGGFWAQVNGRDWTVKAFLGSSRGGLDLDLAQDQATQAALLRALPQVLDSPLADLQGRRLEAADFDRLIAADPLRDLLAWLDDPQGVQAGWDPARWEVFAGRCRQYWRLDPLADGPLGFAAALAHRDPALEPLWERYREAWRRYPGLAGLLEQVTPRDMLAPRERLPALNDREEAELRRALNGLEGKAQQAARAALMTLEQSHGERRDWLWAEMDRAPLALALAPLAELATLTAEAFGGADPESLANAYRERFWRVDALALEALSLAPAAADQTALEQALKAVYVPWLEYAAHRFQTLVRGQGGLERSRMLREPQPAGYQAPPECWVFVDGLRWDVAQGLCRRLESHGLSPHLETRWSTVPSVTASGKVACSPLALEAGDSPANDGFVPRQRDSGKDLDTPRLRKGLTQSGWQVLLGGALGEPTGRAWAEYGDLDHYGHDQGLKLARDLPLKLREVEDYLLALHRHGWRRIRVVTDHGWLLVPGGLPKVELPKFLTETRWGRCALLKPQAPATDLTLSWSWGAEVAIALAPGIGSFIAGKTYDHGGLSLQESLLPEILITAAGVAELPGLEVLQVQWRGLRCRVTLAKADGRLSVDLRRRANDPAASVSSGAKVFDQPTVSLIVEDGELEGQPAVLVVCQAGRVVHQQTVTIGKDAP